MLYFYPVAAALVGWLVSMTTRQAGHFFFEPKGYDHVNQATHEHKEDIKVGYNLRRKVVLMSAWALLPVLLWLQPSVFGLIEPAVGLKEYLHDVGMAWLALGVAGLTLRVLQLWVRDDLMTGLTWAFKIITDPFHDVKMYYRAPIYLAKGQFLDPMDHVKSH
jgi:hypothetical protein